MNASNNAGESTIFVEFMLELIRDLLRELAGGSSFETEKTTEDKVMDSVPYQYIKEKVDVCITDIAVEVYSKNERIASHRRLTG